MCMICAFTGCIGDVFKLNKDMFCFMTKSLFCIISTLKKDDCLSSWLFMTGEQQSYMYWEIETVSMIIAYIFWFIPLV